MTRFATEDGAFEIDSLPSQCQVAICHGFYIKPDSRGQGAAYELKQYQNDCIRDLGYNYAICTVIASNMAQKRVLARQGWLKLTDFYSERQDEDVEIWGYEP